MEQPNQPSNSEFLTTILKSPFFWGCVVGAVGVLVVQQKIDVKRVASSIGGNRRREIPVQPVSEEN